MQQKPIMKNLPQDTPARQSLEEYLKSCSDNEYAEYIISTMHGSCPSEWDKAIKEAIEAIRSRPHTSAPAPERIGSIRTNVFMSDDKEWLIERVNAGMGEWEYVISYVGEYFATAASETIARSIVLGCQYHPHTGAPSPDKPKFSSEDLLLLAHDEWKRREERKHLHNEQDWISGFINGFLTEPTWARKMVDKIRADAKHPSTKGGAR